MGVVTDTALENWASVQVFEHLCHPRNPRFQVAGSFCHPSLNARKTVNLSTHDE
jgi:hypothetical protein